MPKNAKTLKHAEKALKHTRNFKRAKKHLKT